MTFVSPLIYSEERDQNKQSIEMFQSSLRQQKLSTMASIKGGTFIPTVESGLGIYNPSVLAAMDMYADIGEALSTSYHFQADGVTQAEHRYATNASLPPRLEPTNRGMPRGPSSPTGLNATVRSPVRAASAVAGGGGGGGFLPVSADGSPLAPRSSSAFGTGGFGSVRGGSALLSGSRSTGSLHGRDGSLLQTVVSGGGEAKPRNDVSTTIVTTAHIAKSYPQAAKSSQLFKDAPNDDPLRFVDREAVTNADIAAAAARTRAIKFKLCATSPGSVFNNKVYDVEAAQDVRATSAHSPLSRSSSAAALAAAERSESDGGSGPVSIRTTSLVKLASRQYLPVPAGNGIGVQPVPDMAWDTTVDERYLPVSTTDMQPEKCALVCAHSCSARVFNWFLVFCYFFFLLQISHGG